MDSNDEKTKLLPEVNADGSELKESSRDQPGEEETSGVNVEEKKLLPDCESELKESSGDQPEKNEETSEVIVEEETSDVNKDELPESELKESSEDQPGKEETLEVNVEKKLLPKAAARESELKESSGDQPEKNEETSEVIVEEETSEVNKDELPESELKESSEDQPGKEETLEVNVEKKLLPKAAARESELKESSGDQPEKNEETSEVIVEEETSEVNKDELPESKLKESSKDQPGKEETPEVNVEKKLLPKAAARESELKESSGDQPEKNEETSEVIVEEETSEVNKDELPESELKESSEDQPGKEETPEVNVEKKLLPKAAARESELKESSGDQPEKNEETSEVIVEEETTEVNKDELPESKLKESSEDQPGKEETLEVNVEKKLLPKAAARESELKESSGDQPEKNEETSEVIVEEETSEVNKDELPESKLKESSKDQPGKEETPEVNVEKKLLPKAAARESELKESSGDQPEKNEETSEVIVEEETSEVNKDELPESELKESSKDQPGKEETPEVNVEKKLLLKAVTSVSEFKESSWDQQGKEETSKVNVEEKKLLPEAGRSDSELKESSGDQPEENEETSEVNVEEKKLLFEAGTSDSEVNESSGDQPEKNEETSEVNVDEKKLLPKAEKNEAASEVNVEDKMQLPEVDASESELKEISRNQPEKNEETSEVNVDGKKLLPAADASEPELKESSGKQPEKNEETSEANVEEKKQLTEIDASGSEMKDSSGDLPLAKVSWEDVTSPVSTNFDQTDSQSKSSKKESIGESQGFSVADINDDPEDQDKMGDEPGISAKSTCESQGFTVGDIISENSPDCDAKTSDSKTKCPLNSENSSQESESLMSTNHGLSEEKVGLVGNEETPKEIANKESAGESVKNLPQQNSIEVEPESQKVIRDETADVELEPRHQSEQPQKDKSCESQVTPVTETVMVENVKVAEPNSQGNRENTEQLSRISTVHQDENARKKSMVCTEHTLGESAPEGSESPNQVESKEVEDGQMQIQISAVCSLSTDHSSLVDRCNDNDVFIQTDGNKLSTVEGSGSAVEKCEEKRNVRVKEGSDGHGIGNTTNSECESLNHETDEKSSRDESNKFPCVSNLETEDPGLVIDEKSVKDCSNGSFDGKGKQNSKKGRSPEKGKISIGYLQENERYKCFLCNEVGSGTSFEEHVMQHILWKPYKCLYCGQFFITRADIGKHVADDHNGKSLKCGLRAIKKAREFMKTAKKQGDYTYFSQKLNDMYWSCRQNVTVVVGNERETSPDKTEENVSKDGAEEENEQGESHCLPVPEEKHGHVSTGESSVSSNEIQPRSHDFVTQLSRPDINKLIAMYKETDVHTVGEQDHETAKEELQVDVPKNQNSQAMDHKMSKPGEAEKVNQIEPVEVLDSPTENVQNSLLSSLLTSRLLLPKDGNATIIQTSSSEINKQPTSSGFQAVNQIPHGAVIAQNRVTLMSQPLKGMPTPLSPPILVPVSISPIISLPQVSPVSASSTNIILGQSQNVHPGVIQNTYGNILSPKAAVVTSPPTSVKPSTALPTSNVVAFIPGQQILPNVQFLPQNVAPLQSNKPSIQSTSIDQNSAYQLVFIPNQPPTVSVTTDNQTTAVASITTEKQAMPKTSPPERRNSNSLAETTQTVVTQNEIIGVDVKTTSAPKTFPNVFSIGCVKENYVCCACKSKYKQEATFRGHLWNHLHPDCKPCQVCKQKDGGNGRKIIACEKTDGYIQMLRTHKIDAISHIEVKISPTERPTGASRETLCNIDQTHLLNASIPPPPSLPAHSKPSLVEVTKASASVSPTATDSSRDNIPNMEDANQQMVARADVDSRLNEMSVPVFESSTASNTSSRPTESGVSADNDSNSKESANDVATSNEPVSIKPALPNTSLPRESATPSRPSTKWQFYVCGAFCGYSSLYSNDFKKHIIECPLRNSLSCAHCQYFADTPDGLIRHLSKHYVAHTPGIALHSCIIPTCRFRSNILQGLYQHVTGCHPNPPRYMCSNCKDVFQSLASLMEHLQRNVLHVVSCKHCSAKDLTKSVIVSHIKESHPDKGRMTMMVKQLLCKDRKDNEENFDKQNLSAPHSSADTGDTDAENVGDRVELEIDRAHSPEPEQDSDHGKPGPDSEKVSVEILPLSSEPVYSCCICSYVGVNQKDLNTHMPKHVSVSAAKTLAFSCPECPEEFNLLSNFENHLKKHEDNLRYEICSCLICKMRIGGREEIERHIKTEHEMVIGNGREFVGLTLKVSNPDVYKCQKCSYKCLGNSTLQEHLKRHEATDGKIVPKGPPAKENTVPKQSDHSEQEKTVMRIPSSSVYVKPIKCIKCSLSFIYKSNIQKHVSKSHPDVTIVQMHSFATSPTKASVPPVLENVQQSTEESLKIGSGVLDTELEWLYENHCTFFRCLFCSKDITKKNLLHNHLLDHLQISLWKCPLCDFKTSRRIVISDHVKEVHKAEKSVEEIIPLIDEIQTEVKRVLGDLKGQKGLLKDVKPPLGTKEMDEELKQQYKRIGNKKRICKVCDIEYQSSYAIHSHILRMHIKQLIFSCSYCDFSAIDRYSVAKHLAESHSAREKIVKYSPAKIRKRSCKNGKPASNCEETLKKQKMLTVNEESASTVSVSEEDKSRKLNDNTPDVQAGIESCSRQNFHPLADDKHCGIRIGSDALHQRLFGLYSLKKSKERILQCRICSSDFFSRYTLHSHLLRHLSVNLVGCPYCELETIEKKELIDHIGSVHQGQKVHFQFLKVDIDDICKKYLQSNHLEVPKEKTSPSKSRPSLTQLISGRKAKVSTSPKRSPPKSPEKQPVNIICITKGSLKKFKCKFCDYMALTKTSVQRHLMQTHKNDEKNEVKFVAKKSTLPEKMTCNFCSFSSTMAEVLRSHYKDKHPQKNAEQKEVSKSATKTSPHHQLKSPEAEKVHKRRKSRESKDMPENRTSDTQTTDEGKEKEDESKTEDIQQSEENLTDISETVKLRKRKETVTNEPNKETNSCKKMKLESEEKYQCQKCEFKDTKDKAMKHLETEHGIKRLMQCAHCTAKFFFNNDLRKHISFLHKGKDVKFKVLSLDLMLDKIQMKKKSEKQESTVAAKETNFTKPTEGKEKEGVSCSTSTPGTSTNPKLVKTPSEKAPLKTVSSSSSTSKQKDAPKNEMPSKSMNKSSDHVKQDSETVSRPSTSQPPARPSNPDNKQKRSRKSEEMDKIGKPAKSHEPKKQKMDTDDTSVNTSCEIKTKGKKGEQVHSDETRANSPEKTTIILPPYVPSSPDNSDDERQEYYSYLCVYCDYKENRKSKMKLHIADHQIDKFFKGTKPTNENDIKKIKMKVRDIMPICSSRGKNKKEKRPEGKMSTKEGKPDEPSVSKQTFSKEASKKGISASGSKVKETGSSNPKDNEKNSAKQKISSCPKDNEKKSAKQQVSSHPKDKAKESDKQKVSSCPKNTEKKSAKQQVSSSHPKDKEKESDKQKISSCPKDTEKKSAKQQVSSSHPKDKEKKSAMQKPRNKEKESIKQKDNEKESAKLNVSSCPKDSEEESVKENVLTSPEDPENKSLKKGRREGLPIAVKKEKVSPKKATPRQPADTEEESDSEIEIGVSRPRKSKIRRRFLSSSDEECEGETKKSFKRPNLSPSGGRLTYCCHMCSYKAKSLYNFRLHLATHGTFTHLNADMASPSLLRCGFCDFLADSKEEFSKHVEKHLDGTIYKCGYCKYDSYHSKNMRSHLKNKHRHKPTKIINLRDLLKEKAQKPSSVAQLVNMDPQLRLVDSLENFSDILEEAGLKTLDMPLSMLPFLKQEDKHNIPMQIEYEDDMVDDEDDEDYVIIDETGETDSDVDESDDESDDGENLVFYN